MTRTMPARPGASGPAGGQAFLVRGRRRAPGKEKPMGTEQDNGAIVRRLFDRVWNGGDLSAIEDLVDDQFTNFGVRRPGGHAAMRHIVTAWRTAFPDLRFEIQEEIVHDDKVVLRVMLRGTHLGEFPPGVGPARIMGAMPPTGRSFEADQIHIHRVAGGKLVEHAASRNDLLMLAQLGLLPGIKAVSEAAWRTPATPGPPPSA